MTGSSGGGTPPTCPNGHPVAFAGQRFCEVCRMAIGGPAGPAAPEPPSLPVAPPPAYFAPPPVATLPPAPYAPAASGRRSGRSVQPMLLGFAVCLAVVAAAAFVVGRPFGGGAASPSLTPGTVPRSLAVTSVAAGMPPAPTNFTATRKSDSVPCPSADGSCSETDLAWSSTADPSTWFRVYWAGTGADPNATCLTVAAEAKIRPETKPAARSVSIFDPMAVGGGEICWWMAAANSSGESAQVPAAGQ